MTDVELHQITIVQVAVQTNNRSFVVDFQNGKPACVNERLRLKGKLTNWEKARGTIRPSIKCMWTMWGGIEPSDLVANIILLAADLRKSSPFSPSAP